MPKQAVLSAMRSAIRHGVDPYNSADTQAKRLQKIMSDRLRRLDTKTIRILQTQAE